MDVTNLCSNYILTFFFLFYKNFFSYDKLNEFISDIEHSYDDDNTLAYLLPSCLAFLLLIIIFCLFKTRDLNIFLIPNKYSIFYLFYNKSYFVISL